jgi:hypothetical protein
VFCLSEVPSAEAVHRIHTRNGIPPADRPGTPMQTRSLASFNRLSRRPYDFPGAHGDDQSAALGG